MSGSLVPAVTVQDFRTNYTEFSDTAKYSDTQVGNFLLIGTNLCNSDRWGEMYLTGVQLFTAHMLALSAGNQKGIPGRGGLISGKSLGKGSLEYDTNATTIKNGAAWNLTTYGVQFLWWAQLVGSGGVQISGPMLALNEPAVYSGYWPVI